MPSDILRLFDGIRQYYPLCSFDNRKKALLVFPMNTLNISIVFLRILSLRCGARFWYRRPV